MEESGPRETRVTVLTFCRPELISTYVFFEEGDTADRRHMPNLVVDTGVIVARDGLQRTFLIISCTLLKRLTSFYFHLPKLSFTEKMYLVWHRFPRSLKDIVFSILP